MGKSKPKVARTITIVDVARRAGVSVASASRALSGRGYASKEVRERVREAARELNYRLNASARSLKLSRTNTIGLVITDIVNPFYSYLADGVLECANRLGYHVILCATNESPAMEREYLKVLMEKRVDGIVAVSTGENRKLWREVMDLPTQVVLVDREIPGVSQADVVLVDNVKGGYLATEHLIRLGHRRIGIICGPTTTTTGKGRLDGYQEALRRAGIPEDPDLVLVGTFMRESGARSVRALLSLADPPSAIFAANNVLAEVALFAIREHGLKIPDDISLVMFDDVPWASLVTPRLTAVAQPTHNLGYTSMKLMAQRLQEAEEGIDRVPMKVVLDPELIVRDSAVPYPGVAQGRGGAAAAAPLDRKEVEHGIGP